MWLLHKMIAELWNKQKNGTATKDDIKELELCMEANMNMVLKLTKLENESLLASMTNDKEWQNDICANIDKLTEKVYNN